MRIGIVGAHGVGKTTLQRLLQCAYPDAIPLPDFGRFCPYETGLNTTPEAQTWILERQLHVERAFRSTTDIAIFDNISLAHYAYYKRRCGANSQIEAAAVESSRSLDVLIYLSPTDKFLVHDGLRPADQDFQRSIVDEQLNLFQQHKVPLQHAPLGWQAWKINEWQNYVSQYIESIISTEVTQHFVVLGLVRHAGKVLFILRNNINIPDAHNKWDLPGGRVESLESIESAVCREILEETGYLVRPTTYLPFPIQNEWHLPSGISLHINIVAMNCELLHDQPILSRVDSKVTEVRWITEDEINALDLIKGIKPYLNEVLL